MSGIKYYQLAKGEEMPDEFCVVRDVYGEPSEYMFYVPEAENAKLREHLNELMMIGSFNGSCRRDCRYMNDCLADRFGQPDCFVCQELQELGIEVDEC